MAVIVIVIRVGRVEFKYAATKSPPIGGARQNAAELNYAISADIQVKFTVSLLGILRQTMTELIMHL